MDLSQGLAGMNPVEVALGAGFAGIVLTTMICIIGKPKRNCELVKWGKNYVYLGDKN